MRTKWKIAAATALAAFGLSLVGCASQADIAAENLSTAAEQFEVNRRIVFYNGITDKVMYQIEGRCSVETGDSALAGSLEVTCKVGPNAFNKSFLGLSDNVSYMVQQLADTDVSVYTYRFIVRPDQVIPDIEVDTGVGK